MVRTIIGICTENTGVGQRMQKYGNTQYASLPKPSTTRYTFQEKIENETKCGLCCCIDRRLGSERIRKTPGLGNEEGYLCF